MRFTKICLFFKMLGFTQSHSGNLGDFERFFHLIPEPYKSDKPIGNTGIEKRAFEMWFF